MHYRVGIENNFEGRSIAWALEHPGCFAYGKDSDTALSLMPKAIVDYSNWLSSHNQGISWLKTEDIKLRLEDNWEVYSIDEQFELTEQGYEVNAWFRHDWKPLIEKDVSRAAILLSFSREDLLSAVIGLNQSKLAASYPGEGWSIAGILEHVGRSESWYLSTLGLPLPHIEPPPDPLVYLDVVRKQLLDILPGLIGFEKVVGMDGEFWSPRKVLRRAMWHERDHTAHIYKLRNKLE